MKVLYMLLSSIIGGLLYKAGGHGKPFKTWVRDWLIPLVALLTMIFILKIKAPWYIHFISYGLLGASLTTYWDDSKNKIKDAIARIINWNYPEDNFYLHGLFIGLAYMPYAFGIGWFPLIIRALVLAVTMGLINYLVHKFKVSYSVWIEELSRGFLLVISLLILVFFIGV